MLASDLFPCLVLVMVHRRYRSEPNSGRQALVSCSLVVRAYIGPAIGRPMFGKCSAFVRVMEQVLYKNVFWGGLGLSGLGLLGSLRTGPDEDNQEL